MDTGATFAATALSVDITRAGGTLQAVAATALSVFICVHLWLNHRDYRNSSAPQRLSGHAFSVYLRAPCLRGLSSLPIPPDLRASCDPFFLSVQAAWPSTWAMLCAPQALPSQV